MEEKKSSTFKPCLGFNPPINVSSDKKTITVRGTVLNPRNPVICVLSSMMAGGALMSKPVTPEANDWTAQFTNSDMTAFAAGTYMVEATAAGEGSGGTYVVVPS